SPEPTIQKKTSLQPNLHRVVIRRDPILHPLNIAEAGVWAWTHRVCAVRIDDDRRRIDISQARQFGRFVSDVRDVERNIRRDLALNPKGELLNVGTSFIRVLRAL